ncbi:hypothetical protein [Nonomuraea salmonea]|uniref:hypothetical protein n=1 Tax=Nonomuraea salmonea TaxID=46181 RepID=UPI0031E54563
MTSGRQRRRVVPDFMAAAKLAVPEHISVERTTLVYVAPRGGPRRAGPTGLSPGEPPGGGPAVRL